MNKPFFSVGPFADIEERLGDFSSSMYLQKLYNDTVRELVETETAYQIAKQQEDADDVIKSLRDQLKFLENIVALANNNMTSFTSDKIYYD